MRRDPYDVLGLSPGASESEAAAAYRRAAKRFHPDRDPSDDAQARMAEINAAYDLLRDGLVEQLDPDGQAATPGKVHAQRAPRAADRLGLWLQPQVRAALAPELLAVLEDGEEVSYVVSSSTWSSPEVLLAVGDRRLLWLPLAGISPRVHALRYKLIEQVEVRLRRPRRKVATVRVEAVNGRRFSFGELRPETASAIARHVAEKARAAAGG